tara:strand:+ start:116 stop:1030 length:915 start_codon:yes stop_codon:yes gene_type:complete
MTNTKNTTIKKPTLLQTILALFCSAFMWGTGNAIARSLLIEGINGIFIVTTRVSMVGVLIFSYYFLFNRDKFNKTLLKEGSVTGLFSIFIVMWSFIFALEFISSGLVTLMISSAPIFTIFWLKILLKEEEISTKRYLAIAIGFLGIAYLFITKETGLLDQGNIFLGGSLAFIGVQSISLATVLNRKYAPKYKVSTWLGSQYPLVVLLSLLAYIISGVGVSPLDSSQKIRLVILALFNLGAFLSFTWLIQRVSTMLVVTVDYLVPIVGVTTGVIFLNESFNLNIVISSIFIFFSLLLITKEEFSS